MALRLGYASPARMLREMRPSELGTWMALYAVDPWGEERADLRAGIVASTMANIHRGKGTEAFAPSDFMPEYSKQKKNGGNLAERLRGFLKGIPRKRKKG